VHAAISQAKSSLSQERFYLNPTAKKEKRAGRFRFTLQKNSGFETLEKDAQSITDHALSGGFLLNHDRTSFFRVTYNSQH